MKTKLLASTLTLGLASSTLAFGLSAAPAQASITMWNAKTTAGWCTWQPPAVTGSIIGGALAGNMLLSSAPAYTGFGGCAEGKTEPGGAFLPDTLSWGFPGTPAGQSQLIINNANGVPANAFVPSGPVIDNPVKLTTGDGFTAPPYLALIHSNNAISSENGQDFLTSALLLNSVLLTPVPGSVPPGKDGSPQDLGPLGFGAEFLETNNSPAGGICADGSAPGGGAPTAPGFGCPDIFVFNDIVDASGNTTIIPNVEFFNALAPRSFMRDGFNYSLFAQIAGLQNLSPATCQLVVSRNDCAGIITLENQDNAFDIRVRLTKEAKAPEPSSLAGILAVGMVGLGLLGKRKKAE